MLLHIKMEYIWEDKVKVTEAVKEYHMKDAIKQLEEMDTTQEISSVIREY